MTDKNMADVADKAVDKLSQVADAIGRMAPGIWDSAVRSERVEGIANLLVMAALLVVSVFPVRKFLAEHEDAKKNGYRDPEVVVIWGLVCLVVLGVSVGVTASNIGTELSRAISPEYYAAHVLLQAAK